MPKKSKSEQAKLSLSIVDTGDQGHLTLQKVVNPENGTSHAVLFDDLDDNQEMFLPIHDFPRYTKDEIKIINHPSFQRLRKVYQLGQSHLVFPGATHKRFEHSLGTVWVAQKMVNAINTNYHRSEDGTHNEDTDCLYDKITVLESRFVRLAALLHDIGHVPAGHTLEDELGILPKHDEDQRLTYVLQKTNWISGLESESLEFVINETYKHYLPNDAQLKPVDIFKLLVSKDTEKDERHEVLGIKLKVCRDIVGNTICADLLDYLYRDWHHIGKPRYFDTRLFQYMQVRRERISRIPHLVISVGTQQRPRYDAITSILTLLEIRYELAEVVIYHPTKCSAAAMLERALKELSEAVPRGELSDWKTSLTNKLMRYSDEEFIESMLDDACKYNSQPAITIFQALVGRNLYKNLITLSEKEITSSAAEKIIEAFAGKKPNEETVSAENAKVAAENRFTELRRFEEQLDLPIGSIVMYCPKPQMNSKIAKVKIILDDVIKTLDQWDSGTEHIAGEHTIAQHARFRRLWRVQICISPALKDALNRDKIAGGENYHLLETAARLFLLGNANVGKSLPAECVKWAQEMSRQTSNFTLTGRGKFNGRTASMLTELAARGGMSDKYVMGACSIDNLFAR